MTLKNGILLAVWAAILLANGWAILLVTVATAFWQSGPPGHQFPLLLASTMVAACVAAIIAPFHLNQRPILSTIVFAAPTAVASVWWILSATR